MPKSTLFSFFLAISTLSAQQDSTEWFPDVWVKSLKPNWAASLSGTSIRGATKEDFLAVFYPGSPDLLQSASDSEDQHNLRLWSCPDCPKWRYHPMMFENDTDLVDFPNSRNFTQLIQDDTFKNEMGHSYRLLSFSTAEDFPESARWAYGVLSLALLRSETNDSWKILDFVPNMDASGMYMRAQAPDKVLFTAGEHFLFLSDNPFPCGPHTDDYSPCFADQMLYAFYQGKLSKVLEIRDVSCANFGMSYAKGSEWSSQLSLKKSDATLPDLLYEQKGNLYFDDLESVKYFRLSDKVKALIKLKKNVKFSYFARYRFENGQYRVVEDAVK